MRVHFRFVLSEKLIGIPVANRKMSQPMEEQTSQKVFGGCEGPDAMYVKLISSDGHEFIGMYLWTMNTPNVTDEHNVLRFVNSKNAICVCLRYHTDAACYKKPLLFFYLCHDTMC